MGSVHRYLAAPAPFKGQAKRDGPDGPAVPIPRPGAERRVGAPRPIDIALLRTASGLVERSRVAYSRDDVLGCLAGCGGVGFVADERGVSDTVEAVSRQG